MTKLSKFRPSPTSRQVTWVRFHWNYIFINNFSYWKARKLASKIVSALSEQNISQASYFENSLFRIKQLTMLFAAHEARYWFRVIHFYITVQKSQSNCNSIVLLRSDFASIFITPPSWYTAHSTDAVVQLVVSIDFISVCKFGSTVLIAVRLGQVLDRILRLHASQRQCELLHFGDIPKKNAFHISSPKCPSPKRRRRTVPFRKYPTYW